MSDANWFSDRTRSTGLLNAILDLLDIKSAANCMDQVSDSCLTTKITFLISIELIETEIS